MNASQWCNIPSINDKFMLKDGWQKDEGKTKDVMQRIIP